MLADYIWAKFYVGMIEGAMALAVVLLVVSVLGIAAYLGDRK